MVKSAICAMSAKVSEKHQERTEMFTGGFSNGFASYIIVGDFASTFEDKKPFGIFYILKFLLIFPLVLLWSGILVALIFIGFYSRLLS
jgi:hypothetical protein